MISEQDKELIRQCFKSERMNIVAFVPPFYAEFFAACPDTRSLFPDNLTQKEEKFSACYPISPKRRMISSGWISSCSSRVKSTADLRCKTPISMAS